MLVNSHADISSEMSDDFFDDFNLSYQRCEQVLIELEATPNDQTLTDDLFRSVHTIKGNLIYIGLKELSPLLQGVEDILELLRSGHFYYDELLSDLILLAMDKTKLLVDENLFGAESQIGPQCFDNICRAISAVAEVPRRDRQSAMYQAIALLDPSTQLRPPAQSASQWQQQTDDFMSFLASQGLQSNQDITFVSQLIPAMEERSSYWNGRSFRICRLGLLMNQYAQNPVDPNQLAMAMLMHDITMAFLPVSLLHKEQPFNVTDKKRMQSHVRSAHDLVSKMANWEDACEIILQHHERCDGSGYPRGLTADEIAPGAKILAIADTFDACCYARAYKTEQKRPLIRAVLEINQQSGTLFDSSWVEVFNQIAKQHFVAH